MIIWLSFYSLIFKAPARSFFFCVWACPCLLLMQNVLCQLFNFRRTVGNYIYHRRRDWLWLFAFGHFCTRTRQNVWRNLMVCLGMQRRLAYPFHMPSAGMALVTTDAMCCIVALYPFTRNFSRPHKTELWFFMGSIFHCNSPPQQRLADGLLNLIIHPFLSFGILVRISSREDFVHFTQRLLKRRRAANFNLAARKPDCPKSLIEFHAGLFRVVFSESSKNGKHFNFGDPENLTRRRRLDL